MMNQELGELNSLVSHFFKENKNKNKNKNKNESCYFARWNNYLNKENSDSVKVSSGLVIILGTK